MKKSIILLRAIFVFPILFSNMAKANTYGFLDAFDSTSIKIVGKIAELSDNQPLQLSQWYTQQYSGGNRWYFNNTDSSWFISHNGIHPYYNRSSASVAWLYTQLYFPYDGICTIHVDYERGEQHYSGSNVFTQVALFDMTQDSLPEQSPSGSVICSINNIIANTMQSSFHDGYVDQTYYIPAGMYTLGIRWYNNGYGWMNNTYPSFIVKNIELPLYENRWSSVIDSTILYVSGSDTVDYLDSVTLTAITTDTHFFFSHWSDGDSTNPRIVVADSNKTLYAFFDAVKYNLFLSSSGHGSVYGSGNYRYLSDHIIRAIPDPGYHFYMWSDGITDNPRTIALTNDTMINALFVGDPHTITVQPNLWNRGNATGGGLFHYGDTITLTATANHGYHFDHWEYGNHIHVLGNPANIVVTGDREYIAWFEANQYTVSVNQSPNGGGTINGGGSHEYNSSCTITATANYGYHFSMWSDGETENPRTFTLTQDTSFTAIFEPNSYFISTSSNDSSMGTVIGGGLYDYNTTQTLEAVPAEGHHFIRWTDGNTDNLRNILIEGDTSYTAVFAIDTLTVNVSSNNMVYGTVNGGGTFVYGSPCTIEAEAYSGYVFVRWSNGVTYNPYTFAVLTNMDIEAVFAPEGSIHNVTVQVQPAGTGTVTGGGPYANGETVTLEAIPNDGYHFVRWQDDVTDNPRTIFVTTDMAFTAFFEADDTQGIVDANSNGIQVWAADGSIIIEGYTDEAVHVYDMMGREVASSISKNGTFRIHVRTGVYLVKVGNHPIWKVVVLK